MYIFRSDNRLEVPITLHSFKGMAEEVALIDSGATENFIDQETIKKLKLGSKKLSEPVRLRNINGTYNQSGSVTNFINLLVNRGGRKIMQRFYVTNLGSDRIILGYPCRNNSDRPEHRSRRLDAALRSGLLPPGFARPVFHTDAL